MVYILTKIRNYVLNSKFKVLNLKNSWKIKNCKSSKDLTVQKDDSGFWSSNSSKISSKTVIFSKTFSILISRAMGFTL